MKITKRQLKRIIKEYSAQRVSYTDDEIIDYLTTQALHYHRDVNLNPSAIKELLMDDFMDNLGAYVDFTPAHAKLVDHLANSGEVNESRLLEYSDYPSWLDLSDQIDDVAEMLDLAADKYVTSAWLASAENKGNAIAKGVAERLEQLYRDAEALGGLIRGSGALK